MPRADSLPKEKNLPNGLIIVPEEILRNKNLSPIDKIIYGLILATDLTDEGSFWANDSIKNLLDISQPVISKSYTTLAEHDLITIEYEHKPGRTICRVKNNCKLFLLPIHYKKTISDPKRNLLANSTIINNSTLKDNKRYSDAERIASSGEPSRITSRTGNAAKQRASTRKKTPDPIIQRVIDHFRTSVKSELKFDPVIEPRDYKTVKDRLKQFSYDEIISIINYCLKSDKAQWQREHATLSSWLSANTINQYKASKSGNGSSRFTQGGGIKAEAGKYAHLGKEV